MLTGDLILFLNNVMALLDETMEQYDVFKVDTVGDAYVLASGEMMNCIACITWSYCQVYY